MTPFLQVVELLISDGDAKEAYASDPDGFLDGHGLGRLDSADVADAMRHAGDALPIGVATRLDPNAGLSSAASIDLTADGLSLDREPLGDISMDDLSESDGSTDASRFGEDVEFDSPETDAGDAIEASITTIESDFQPSPDPDGNRPDVSPDEPDETEFDELTDLEPDSTLDPEFADEADPTTLQDLEETDIDQLGQSDWDGLDF